MSEPRRISLDMLESSAYESLELPESFGDNTTQLQAVFESVPTEDARNEELKPFTRRVVWELGDSALRHTMAIGSIAMHTWPRRVPASPARKLYFSHSSEFKGIVDITNEQELATHSLTAVASRYLELVGYIPSAITPWAVDIGSLQDKSGQQRIGDALTGLRFSDGHIDSEDMDDAHPVSQYLFDSSLSVAFRQRLLTLARVDAESTDYKPWAWQAQLSVTLKHLANEPEHPLRFTARNTLSLPESDDKYAGFVEQEAARIAQERSAANVRISNQEAEHEASLQASQERVRSIVTLALH